MGLWCSWWTCVSLNDTIYPKYNNFVIDVTILYKGLTVLCQKPWATGIMDVINNGWISLSPLHVDVLSLLLHMMNLPNVLLATLTRYSYQLNHNNKGRSTLLFNSLLHQSFHLFQGLKLFRVVWCHSWCSCWCRIQRALASTKWLELWTKTETIFWQIDTIACLLTICFSQTTFPLHTWCWCICDISRLNRNVMNNCLCMQFNIPRTGQILGWRITMTKQLRTNLRS